MTGQGIVRLLSPWWIIAVACAVVASLLAGLGPVFAGHGYWWAWPGIVLFTIVFAHTLYLEVFRPGHRLERLREGLELRSAAEFLHELELGLMVVSGCYLLIALTGGLYSYLYPACYAFAGFAAVVHEDRRACAAWLGVAVLLELGTGLHAQGPGAGWLVAQHLAFYVVFSVGNFVLLRGLVGRLRADHNRRLAHDLERVKREARDFRVDCQQWAHKSERSDRPRSREDAERRVIHGSVEAIREQLAFDLELLAAALRLHSCVLLWVDGRGGSATRSAGMQIKQAISASDRIIPVPTLGGEGVLAAVMREPKTMRLTLLDERRVPPYYTGADGVTDLCAVPIMEGPRLSGILCADRLEGDAFSNADQSLLEDAARQIIRVVALERAFAAVERRKYEQEQFYRASGLLNRALTRDDVCEQAFAAVTSFASCDLLVITRVDRETSTHEVLAARAGDPPDCGELWRAHARGLMGLRFGDGAGLVAAAVKNRHHMPANPGAHDAETVIFDGDHRIEAARSLWVVPLIHGDEVIGTMVLVSSSAGAFPDPTRDMLTVIIHQVAVTLQNARMYELMEERATTDGLTGLTNHRCFQERLEKLEESCQRAGRRFSLILTDIDHFKAVNDTHGHPVGDAVLRKVAAALAQSARKIDIVARYGGEEFVVVLPDTEADGAAQFAERLRKDVQALVMSGEKGQFNVTLSLGVAEYPRDANERQQLIEQADQALYHCKESGRNCVTRWRDMDSAKAGG